MPFKEVLEFLESKNLVHLSPSLAKLKIFDRTALFDIDAALLRQHDWHPTDIVLLLQAIGVEDTPSPPNSGPIPRRDFPKIEPRTRGSVKRAIGAAMPNSRQESIAALQDDFYANSSKPSQQSLFVTWSKLATAWGLQPIPITRQVLLSIGASMKHAGYRSPKNYFYKAAQIHRETLEEDLPPHLHSLMQKILRSIKRGQGPTPFKDSFAIELFNIQLTRTPGTARPGHWFTDTFAARDITLIACWWMLRGIEAAAAKLQHVWFHETNVTKFAYFTLPVQKNDTAGQCVSRGHPCLCRTGEPNPLCPYHAIQRHTKRLHYIFQHYQTEQLPFIPTDNGQFASKNDIMKIFSSAISLTDTPLTRPGPHGEPLPRFGEHVCRVSGAQFLSRLGYSLEAIQLIGRWGSDAVKRYIQEAPLAATPNHILAPQSTDRPDIQQLVRSELERLCNSWWILNQHSNTAHIPAVPETAQNTRWRTLCGWHYGSALYQKTFTRPTENLCRKCFKDTEEDDNGTSSEDELIWRPLQLADPHKTDVHTWCLLCCFIPFRDVSFVGRFSQNILPVSPSTLHHITKMSSFEPPLNFHFSNVSDPNPTWPIYTPNYEWLWQRMASLMPALYLNTWIGQAFAPKIA